MKAVLISIQPQWCELIASGKKTIEVRKSAPKEVPFKAYIYMTATKERCRFWEYITAYQNNKGDILNGSQKVIGEFICDKVDRFYCASVPYRKDYNLGYGSFLDNGVYKVKGWHEGIVCERDDKYIDTMLNNKDLEQMCLTAQEVFDYVGIGKHFYAWHITDLKIYDKPKDLSEFRKVCLNGKCSDCIYEECKITRPPQSWCYVEEL